MSGWPKARETVDVETPAAFAISLMVGAEEGLVGGIVLRICAGNPNWNGERIDMTPGSRCFGLTGDLCKRPPGTSQRYVLSIRFWRKVIDCRMSCCCCGPSIS